MFWWLDILGIGIQTKLHGIPFFTLLRNWFFLSSFLGWLLKSRNNFFTVKYVCVCDFLNYFFFIVFDYWNKSIEKYTRFPQAIILYVVLHQIINIYLKGYYNINILKNIYTSLFNWACKSNMELRCNYIKFYTWRSIIGICKCNYKREQG